MKYCILLSALLLFSCTQKHDALELEILSKEIDYINIDEELYTHYLKKEINLEYNSVKNFSNIITYKLTNNSNKTYYFNLDWLDNNIIYENVKIDKAYLSISDDKGLHFSPKLSQPSIGYNKRDFVLDYLGYSNRGFTKDRNFTIHPEETLYFEWFVILPFGSFVDDKVYTVSLDPRKRYFAEVFIKSDSTKFNEVLSRTDLKTIKENGYEIYHGTIKSKNKIPIIIKSR